MRQDRHNALANFVAHVAITVLQVLEKGHHEKILQFWHVEQMKSLRKLVKELDMLAPES